MDLFLTLIVLCSSLPIIVALRRFGSRRRKHLPPGSLGLPVVGETLQLISAYKSENPEQFIDDRVGRFGSVFTTHVFGEATVFSADPETNRFVLQNEGKLFESSYPSSIENLLGRHSLLIMKGGLHKRLHSLTMSFANSSIIRKHLLADIDRLVRFNLNFWSGRVLLMEQAKKITFELAVKQLMSFDPGEWTESLRKEYVLVMEGFFTVPFFSTTYHRALKARKKVAEALRLVVRERRSKQREVAGDQAGENEWKQDMLEALLNLDDGLSDEEVVDLLVAMLVAGYETTSTIMTLAVKFLTDTPAALAQLKEEHDQTRARKGQSEALEWNDYKSMPFTQCVVNETLRYANIISGVFRRTTTEVHIKGYTIPKDWKLFASFRAVHLDPQHFNNARSFDPWRWQNTNSGSGGQNGNVFTPFGGGPRFCPGHELARVELTVFLYHLIARFSWDPAEEDKLVFFPTTRTLKRYPINVKHRRQLLVSEQQGSRPCN